MKSVGWKVYFEAVVDEGGRTGANVLTSALARIVADSRVGKKTRNPIGAASAEEPDFHAMPSK